MKTLLRKRIINSVLIICCLSLYQTINAQTDGDYRTRSTGALNWSGTTTWQVRAASSWSNTATAPTATASIYIQAGSSVTVDVTTATCNNLSINQTSGVVAIGANTLQVSGKLRGYTGTAVFTTGADGTFYSGQTISSNATPACLTSTANSGKLSFVGSTRAITVTGEWGATSTGVDMEINLTSGQTATPGTNMKAANWLMTSGILDCSTTARVISADNGTTGGNITIASGFVLISAGSPVFQRTGSTSGATLNLNSGAILRLTAAAPTIAMATLTLNGTVDYSRAGIQTLAAAVQGGATVSTYTNLTFSGTSAKTLAVNTTVNGTLSLQGTASLAFGAFTLAYGASSTLEYKGSATQTATATEFPSTGNAKNLIVDNSSGFRLPFSRTVSGNITITSGDVQNLSGAAVTLTMSGTAATLAVAGSITGTDVGTSNDINFVVSGTKTTVSGAGSLIKFLNLTVNSGSTLELSRTVEVKYVATTINGTLQISSGGFLSRTGSSTITYGGSSTLNYNTTYTTTTNEFPATGVVNVTITKPSGTSTVTLDVDKTITGTFAVDTHIVDGGKSLTAANITIGTGSMTMGTLTTSSTFVCSGASSVNLTGSWNVTGFTKSTSTVNFTGTGNLNNATNFYNLTVSSGTRSITANFDVENTLLVSGGQMGVTGGTGKSLTMSGATAAINIAGGSVFGTDAGSGNDLSLIISGAQTTLTGNATGSFDDEKKFFNVTVSSGKKLILARGILCKYGTFAIDGTLQINLNGYVQNDVSLGANAKLPTYGSGATLVYNVGTTYGRNGEWNSTSGAGYPYHIVLQNNTTLDVVNSVNSYKKMAGNLTVNSGSTFNITNLTTGSGSIGVEVLGNIINDGTINLSGTTSKRLKASNFTNGNSNTTAVTALSSVSGGDLELTGNYVDNAVFTANARAVFFTGSGTQTISGTATAPFNIDYVVSAKASGTIRLDVDLLTGGPNGGNTITLTSSTDKLDINGKTLTLGTSSVAGSISGSGVFIGSSSSNMILNGTGAFGSINFDQTTPGSTNALNNLTINRTTSGGIAVGSELNIGGTLTLTDGTVNIGANNLIIGASGSISVSSPDPTRMIIASGGGQLRKVYTGTGSFTFPIGDNIGTAEYSPATLNFTAGSFSSAYAGVALTNSKHSSNVSTTDYINRYWTVTTSGITSPTATASFEYANGDIAGTEANLYGGRYLSSTWNCMGPVNTSTNTISATVSAFGDFTAGELAFMGCCVNPTAGGTIATAQTICTGGDPAAFTSSASPSGETGTLEYKWQLSTTSAVAGFSDIASTNATTYDAPSGLTQTTWYKRLARVTCKPDWTGAAESNVIAVTISTSTTWTGGTSTSWANTANWSCGTPTSLYDVTIGTGTFQPEIITSPTINSLTINSGATLKISSSHNLTVTDAIVNNGTLTVENDANLIQTNNVSNSGSGTTIVDRDSNELYRLDYTLWSSPVTGQNLLDFSPLTSNIGPTNIRFYTYSGANYSQVATPATTDFAPATGYLIRMPNNAPVAPASPIAYSGVFTGQLNNGSISLSSLTNGVYYGTGNPYASTIDADAFITANSLTDALYFWRKTNAAAGSAYATYTLAGGATPFPGTDAGPGDPNATVPNGVIQVGQGFIAKATATSLNFTNAMRIADNTGQFFRNAIVDRSRIWLNLTNADGLFSQTMIAYMTNATSGVDNAIDGRYFNDSQTALTSIINNEEFAVQGRALPFQTSDIVPLGFKTELAGDYTISINSTDGLFQTNNQVIYLKDNLTTIIHNLSAGDYHFVSEAGVFNTRFEIVYEDVLSTSQSIFTAQNVVVYKQGQDIVINTGNNLMSKVKIYDMRGRLLIEKAKIDASETRLQVSGNQVLIVKIISQSNGTVTKKVIN
jgi:hypothetical protein